MICAFNEGKKVNYINIGNRSNLISHETTLYKISNQIIKRRLDISKESGLKTSPLTEFNQKVKKQTPPRNTIKGVYSNTYVPEKAGYKAPHFFNTIQFYFSWFGHFYFEMSIYCGNYSDLDFRHDGIYSIPRKEFANYKRDDAKIRYLEFYMTNTTKRFSARQNIKKSYKQLKIDCGVLYQAYFKELGLPETIKIGKNKKINIYKVFVLLGIFSDLVAPPIRQYEQFGPFYKKGKLVKKFNAPKSFSWTLKHDSQHGNYYIGTPNKPKDWTKHFKGRAINRFEEKELINSLCRLLLPLRLNYTREEIIDILNFLTTDFSERYLNLHHRPFIKIKDNYYWQGSLYRDRHWGNIMYHRISKESLQAHPKLQADILEKKIAELFENVGAKVLKETSDREYKTIDNESGEFDGVCYFKESNTLILIELKTTFIDEDIEKYARYAYDKFEVQAKKQLLRGIREIDTNFDKYQKLLGLQKGYNVVPLIVSNIFYEDRSIIDNKILKLSYLELLVILRNNKDALMSFLGAPVEYLHRSQNQNALHYKGDPISEENTNLWKDPNKFSIEDLLENNIWDFIDKSFDYEKFLFHSKLADF